MKERVKKIMVKVVKSNMEIEDIEEVIVLLSMGYDNVIESLEDKDK